MSVLTAFRRAGVPEAIAVAEVPLASAAMREASITTQNRSAMFIAQVLHESGRLQWFEEIASGRMYEGRRDLGNTMPGDGERFKGRGPIQLTGRANYRTAGHALGLPLEQHPTMAAQHDVGWRIAAWYWRTRGLNELADGGHDSSFVSITRRINGGTNGLDARFYYWKRVRDVDCRPVAGAMASKWKHYTMSEQRWIHEYDQLHGKPARPELIEAMTKQRKAIWRAAQPKSRGGDGLGWGVRARAARYRSLKARTT